MHKLDPRTKFFLLMFLTLAAFLTKDIFLISLIFLISVVLQMLSKINFLVYIKSIKFYMLIIIISANLNLIFSIFSNFKEYGNFYVPYKTIETSIIVFLRFMSLLNLNYILIFTTPQSLIVRAVEYFIKPLKFLGVNYKEVSLMFTMSLKFLPLIFKQTQKIIISQKARGAKFKSKSVIIRIKSFSAVIVPVLYSTFRKADEISCAIISRGYSFEGERTKFKELKFSRYDLIFLVIFIFIVFGVIVCRSVI